MKSNVALSFVVSLLGCLTAAVRADIIYAVDFEDPPHTVDQQVALGPASDRPQFADTSVFVRDSLGDFTTQVASLEPAGAMTFLPATTFSSQIALISWDLAMLDIGSLAPAAVSIGTSEGVPVTTTFMGDMSIQIDGVNVGSYTLGQLDSFAFMIDIDNALYGFSLNGSPVLTDQPLVGTDWVLRDVSFGRGNLADPSYAVDNFQWQIIPEPSTFALMLLALGSLALRQLRR